MKPLPSYKEFRLRAKIREILDELMEKDAFKVDKIVVRRDSETQRVLLEHKTYKQIPKTNLWYRYDSQNTNTKTQDHIHVYQDDNQLYAINRDGSTHDGSKAKLGKKEMKFLQSQGFNVPPDGLLEWKALDTSLEYEYTTRQLLLS